MQLSLSKGTRSGYNRLKQMIAFCFIAPILLIGTTPLVRGADGTPGAAQNVAPEARLNMRGADSTPGAAQNVASAPRLKSTVRVDARTGRLVRVLVPIPAGTRRTVRHAAPDPALQALVEKTAKDYNVSPALVNSVISVESGFNPAAVSWKGAQGIMQLMPATARRFGVSNTFDVRQNVEGGVRYLRFLQDTFKDDQLAIAAYNAGEGAVTKYNGVPPYRETVAYVKKVGQQYAEAKKTDPGRRTEAEAKAPAVAAPPPEEKQPQLVTFYDEHGRLHMVTER
jgi:soluble lytic murein transglycosylase-like protein